MVVTVETDIGITGIGDGGAKDTLEQCAGDTDRQESLSDRGDLAGSVHRLVLSAGAREDPRPGAPSTRLLWDIKGKALNVPVHELLGGPTRDYCECYLTGGAPPGTSATATLSLRERARATIEAGYRAYRMGAGDVPIGDVYDTRSIVRRIEQECREAREGVGPTGTGASTSTSASTSGDAVRCCKAIEPVRSALRRGSRARRTCPGRHPQAAADDRRFR
jgi:L-alanine-DL-glutamate epimerase-like enolase superfamily enzyme